jgi:uncharacterized protein YqeY
VTQQKVIRATKAGIKISVYKIRNHTMSLEQKIMAEMKDAMKAKNEATLRGLRAIKAEIIKAKTEPGANGEISEETEVKMLQKMVKQRRDSLAIYQQQNRDDLSQKEQEEIAVIEKFLPAQLSDDELRKEVKEVIMETGASSPADMGKVMGAATKKLAGRADGKAISAVVKELLSK